jgi:hypothetical protein
MQKPPSHSKLTIYWPRRQQFPAPVRQTPPFILYFFAAHPNPPSGPATRLENKENIAFGDRLGISEAAVKYHMGEITARLQLENKAQAVAFAAGAGFIEKPAGD